MAFKLARYISRTSKKFAKAFKRPTSSSSTASFQSMDAGRKIGSQSTLATWVDDLDNIEDMDNLLNQLLERRAMQQQQQQQIEAERKTWEEEL